MKKSIAGLFLVAVIFLLTMFWGCDTTPFEVTYTVDLIAQLEGQTITLDHESQIIRASQEYSCLPSNLKPQVYNYDVLKNAQEELKILSEQVKNINAKLANIGTDIAPEDIPTLQAIADEYSLLRQDTHEYINGYEKVSIPLKNFEKWYGEGSPYQQLKDLYETGEHEDVIDLALTCYSREIPAAFRNTYASLISNSFHALSKQFIDKGDYNSVILLSSNTLLTQLPDDSTEDFYYLLGEAYLELAKKSSDRNDTDKIRETYDSALKAGVSKTQLSSINQLWNDVLEKKAKSYYNRRNYVAAIAVYSDNKNYGSLSPSVELKNIAADCYNALAKNALNTRKYFVAIQNAQEAQKLASASSIKSDANQIINEAKAKARPSNGAILERFVGSGKNEFTVHSSSSDACIKLESKKNSSQYVLFFVRKNSSATINIADGEYVLKYVTGVDYIDKDNLFLSNKSYSMAEDYMKFDSYSSGGYIYYDTISVTLYTVIGGNMDTESISPDEF